MIYIYNLLKPFLSPLSLCYSESLTKMTLDFPPFYIHYIFYYTALTVFLCKTWVTNTTTTYTISACIESAQDKREKIYWKLEGSQ